jgi:hypothetical protein
MSLYHREEENKNICHEEKPLDAPVFFDVSLICARSASEVIWLLTCSHKKDAALHRSVGSEGLK